MEPRSSRTRPQAGRSALSPALPFGHKDGLGLHDQVGAPLPFRGLADHNALDHGLFSGQVDQVMGGKPGQGLLIRQDQAQSGEDKDDQRQNQAGTGSDDIKNQPGQGRPGNGPPRLPTPAGPPGLRATTGPG